MKKANRIKDNQTFTTVIKTGKFGKGKSFRVYWLENSLNYVRVGIAVSKKLGNAVVRSTSRRRIRAICDELIDYQSNSLDIVIMAKEEFLKEEFLANKTDLENVLVKFLNTRTTK